MTPNNYCAGGDAGVLLQRKLGLPIPVCRGKH
jgi:hypothetical protein